MEKSFLFLKNWMEKTLSFPFFCFVVRGKKYVTASTIVVTPTWINESIIWPHAPNSLLAFYSVHSLTMSWRLFFILENERSSFLFFIFFFCFLSRRHLLMQQQPTTGFFLLSYFFRMSFPAPRRHRMKGEQRNASNPIKRIEKKMKTLNWIYSWKSESGGSKKMWPSHNKQRWARASGGAEQRMLNMGIQPKDSLTVPTCARARTHRRH
jgi:hypothetical protein